jgi:hypothetical protein
LFQDSNNITETETNRPGEGLRRAIDIANLTVSFDIKHEITADYLRSLRRSFFAAQGPFDSVPQNG